MDLKQAKAQFAHAGNEAAILACVLKDPDNYFEVEAKMVETDFLTPNHRAIWTILRTLVRDGIVTLDTASILNQAGSLKLEEEIGGYNYINALFDKRVETSNINFYIERALDASIKLKVLAAADEVAEITQTNRAFTGETMRAGGVLDLAQEKFLRIAVESERSAEAINLAEGLAELLEEAASNPSSVRGLSTGFEILDETINGLEPGTLTVLGARPKVGKSAILMNWAKHIAYECGRPVLYLDTEMNTREQQFRLISMLSGVEERNIKNGIYTTFPDEAAAVDKAVSIINSGLVLHKYYPDFTPEGVSSLARKYFHQHNISCVVFDYIKLPDADLQLIGNVKEHQALGYLCVALKNLAGQLNIPVVTAAQIGRTGANKGRIGASDFADSDRILRYSNTVLGLTYKTKDEIIKLDEEFGRDLRLRLGTHRLQVLDTRAGGTNFEGIDLVFNKKSLHMREASEQLFRLKKEPDEENQHDI
jgi:replicative DNA helicase